MMQTTASVAKLTSVSPSIQSLCLNDIWRLAHQKWEAAGRPGGDNSCFWAEAEQELLQANRVSLARNVESPDFEQVAAGDPVTSGDRHSQNSQHRPFPWCATGV